MNKIPQLKEWIKLLKLNLGKEIKDLWLPFYLLNNEFIEEYLKSNKVKHEKYISKIINENKITEIPPIFPLEKDNLKDFGIQKEETIEAMGEFAYKVLVLKIQTDIYCFYFLDENEELRQGYLRFYRENTENEMINILKSDGVVDFFEKYKIKSDNELFQPGYNFEIIIHNLEEDEKKEKQIVFDDKKIMNSIKYSIEEMKKVIINSSRSKSDAGLGDSKIEIIRAQNRRSSFSKGDKDKDDKEKNKEDKKNFKFKDLFKKKKKIKPGKKGLRNVGATCYMNATLQCFSNSDTLKTELIDKYDEYKKEANTSKKLTFALAEVIFNLWKVLDDKKYIPEDFKRIIGEMNPLFKKVGANDPKDLVLFLLIKIHEETNVKKETNQNICNTPLPNPYNFYSVYNDFNQYYTSNNNSIISKEFYGCVNSITTCYICQNSIHNIQIKNILFFPLEEVRKFKNYTKKEVSIIDCFEYCEKYDMYPSFYCNICRNNCPAYSYSKIINSPKTLIINLNRGRGIEFDVKIKSEEYIDLRNFIYNPQSPYYYELKGVISHFGSNDEGGHFIAYCKNSNNCKWYKFNDEIVEKSSFKDALTKGMPYVLFYSHVDAI